MKTIDAIFDLREAITALRNAITEDVANPDTTANGRYELGHLEDVTDDLERVIDAKEDVFRELEGPVRHGECVQCGRRHDPNTTCTEDRMNEAEYKEDR